MTTAKDPRGRPRVPLNEMHERWRGPSRALVEKHSQRSLEALYDEMLAFMPNGIVDALNLARFMRRYQGELEFIFHPPFAPAPAVADLRRRAEARASLGDVANLAAGQLQAIVQAKMAYHLAQVHVWKRDGSIGARPPPPGDGDGRWFEEQMQTLNRLRRAVAGTRTERPQQSSKHATNPGPTPRPPPTPGASPDLGDEVAAPLQGESWTDNVTWDGKEATTSPRDAMRPYLEAQGRLDLLDLYDDEVIQYGPVVRRWVDGKLR